jgi:hypothetical protein
MEANTKNQWMWLRLTCILLTFIENFSYKLLLECWAGLEPAYTSVVSTLASWWECRRERRKQKKLAWVFSSVDVSDWETVAVNIVWSQQCCVRKDGGAAGIYVYQVSILRIGGQHYTVFGAWLVSMGQGWNSLRIAKDWAFWY